jgi:uncharacterized membrane protein YbhN (UPF0104 family)
MYRPSRRTLNLMFKSAVALLLGAIFWFELRSKDNLSAIWDEFVRHLNGAQLWWLIGAVVLMPFNWLAETQKWYQFVRIYEPEMSRWRAVRAVLAGVSVSLFTPNRVGEYGGRILFVRPENHWKAIIANLVGNFSQFLVLLSAGAIGVLWFIGHWTQPLYVRSFAIMAFVSLIALYFLYFNIRLVIPIARQIPLLHHIKRFVKDIRVLEHFERRELADVLRWATIRYVLYAMQYFFLLRYFGIQTDIISGFSGISTIFLLQTSIPLPPVTGLMARGGLAVQVWSQFGANEASALASTFTLWIINLILPALIGTFSLFYVNISKTLGYEDD